MERCKLCGEMVNYDDPAIHYGGHKCKESKHNKTGSVARNSCISSTAEGSIPSHFEPMPENYIPPKRELKLTKEIVKQIVEESRISGLNDCMTNGSKELVKLHLEKAVKYELERANSIFPQFNSVGDCYTTLKEELEEATEELQFATESFDIYWQQIRSNNSERQQYELSQVKKYAEALSIEVTHLRAMCEKAQAFYDKEGVE